MKAFIYNSYGSAENLNLTEVEKPQPGESELLIKIQAASLNAADKFLLTGKPFVTRFEFGLLKPKNPILGSDLSGVVEAVGSNVTQFKVGDVVMADLSGSGHGAFAEYVCAPAEICVGVSAEITPTDAAALPMASVTALRALRDEGNIQAGQHVLINGASGGVGTFAVQIAKAFGATVTAVCSTGKIDLVRSLGADHVIDYTQEDFTQSGKQYDLIVAVNGNHTPFEYKRAATPTGRIVVIGGSMRQIFMSIGFAPLFQSKNGVTMKTLLAKPNAADLDTIQSMVTAGEVTPVIDRTFALSDLPDAMRYLQTGSAKGKIVVTT